ncbi:hypothetical protein AVEN_235354-1 [Araneus ventricosus]|uniref:Uncharacterized protein n=1 Tax=Araneus ventricosus TaxID=182803 RepID=A0A4Y2A566_ARAVE|nr:hypothetical protein AVEN_235354-1 [Araneus ventricosus]
MIESFDVDDWLAVRSSKDNHRKRTAFQHRAAVENASWTRLALRAEVLENKSDLDLFLFRLMQTHLNNGQIQFHKDLKNIFMYRTYSRLRSMDHVFKNVPGLYKGLCECY